MAVRTARRADDAPGISLDDVVERADRTLAGAVEHLKGLQHAEGWWKGELETNVTMDAEDMMLRQFLGILTPEDAAASARWIRSNQRSDGSWANFYEGPIDLSTTVEAYVALRLAGDDPEAPHMAKAAACVRDAGGFERSRVFTRMWLALFGLWSWDELPALPPEVIFLPRWFPLNVYDFACWARQTIVALTVVGSYRPVRPIGFSIDELRSPEPRARDRNAPLFTAAGVLERLDVVLHQWERLAKTWPVRAGVREVALSKAENWILRRQEADGGWGGIQPPWVYSIIALHLRGYPLDHPALAKGLAGLEGFTIREDGPDGPTRRLEACQSPVWDTALAAIALADAGAAAGDDSLRRASDWILVEEVRVVGDWAVRRPGLQPSGWAFEFANDNYPDIDDTAEVILALRKASGTPAEPTEAVLARAEAWVVGMASRDGGWAAFDADNVRGICRDLPFCDFGEVIDPPSADVTAHVVEMLAASPAADRAVVKRGVDWLWKAQEADGSWFGRWGANYVYGTGAAVPALVAAGVSPRDVRIRGAVRWLEEHQGEDGGWGEDLRSYVDPGSSGRGASTASQTAWALLALVAAGKSRSEAAIRGVRYLVETQRSDGTWDEPWYTGTGFPGDFYINYHLYRLVFPVSALGRWVTAMRGGGGGEPE